jgi:hypothetical protein
VKPAGQVVQRLIQRQRLFLHVHYFPGIQLAKGQVQQPFGDGGHQILFGQRYPVELPQTAHLVQAFLEQVGIQGLDIDVIVQQRLDNFGAGPAVSINTAG